MLRLGRVKILAEGGGFDAGPEMWASWRSSEIALYLRQRCACGFFASPHELFRLVEIVGI